MTRIERVTFISLIIFSVYHSIRDVLQIMGIHNWLADVANYKHNWCRAIAPVCDYYLFPWEAFVFIGSIIVLKRNKVGLLGRSVLFSLIILPIIWTLNWSLG